MSAVARAPSVSAPSGLTEAEARSRRQASPPAAGRSSRSYASIVRANVFTVFNAILLAFGTLTLAFGEGEREGVR